MATPARRRANGSPLSRTVVNVTDPQAASQAALLAEAEGDACLAPPLEVTVGHKAQVRWLLSLPRIPTRTGQESD